jgi:uncharacterized membrane protein
MQPPYHRNQTGYQQEQAYTSEYETQYTSSAYDPQQYERQYYHPVLPDMPGPQYAPPPPAQHAHPPYQQSAFFYAPSGRSEDGVDGRLAAALCYVGFWLTGLLFVLFIRENKFIRFHAMQSLLFFGGVNVLFIFLISTFSRHFFFFHIFHFVLGFAILVFVLLNIIAAVAWFVGLFGALSGKYTKLPFVGDYAERFAARRTTVK